MERLGMENPLLVGIKKYGPGIARLRRARVRPAVILLQIPLESGLRKTT